MLQPITVRTVKSYQQDKQSAAVNVIQIEDEISATFELLKVLHHYNNQNAWTLLIAPDHVPSKALLDSCSIDTSKLLVIRQKHLVNLEYVLSSALHNGNFAAVITWTDIVKDKQISEMALNLEQASARFYCFTKNTQLNNLLPQQQQAC
ncbi:SulA-like leucine-rich domain-containing protein [Pseudoalteromonas mariniglutinosa]|uniref:SulA-like leucine-rich domain-containing protein n=1 Tax=Pseudoalteromonas mariniglutinosa TaxID=206042 RepID=UPI00384C1143